MSLAEVMTQRGLSYHQIANAAHIGVSTLHRISKGEWPSRDASQVRQRLSNVLRDHGATAQQLLCLYQQPQVTHPINELAPACSYHAEAASPAAQAASSNEEDLSMLLQSTGLSQEAKQHFGLSRSPFLDDVQSPDDVFQTPNVRYIRAALMDTAQHHGFMAVVGESGSGKSTMAEDLESRIAAQGQDILVIRPYVLAMEATDTKGKTLKSSHIAEAIARALDPDAKVRASAETRFRQVHGMLKSSRKSGRRHLLVIEEAHCLPIATLKHLKRWAELKDGMQKLLGIALIGQTELSDRLGSQSPELREVAQRCEVVQLSPLDNELEGYLSHKFARFNLKLSDVLAPDACDAIRARLITMPRGGRPADARSMCYPLVVNNLVCRAMNAAARMGWPCVDGQVITSC